MGYETHFRLKGELDQKFKSWMKDMTDDLQEHKDILTAVCMKSYVKDNDYVALSKVRKAINFSLRIYINYIGEHWKKGLEKELAENNNETWFCGWDCSHNESSWTSEKDIEDWFTSQLFMTAIGPFVTEPNENDSRREDIASIIEDIEDSVRDLWRYLFISRYRDSDDAWESDGTTRKFPEEIKEEESREEIDDIDLNGHIRTITFDV